MSQFKVTNLQRGGLLVEWGDFRAQIGAYPETIKDTLVDVEGVPQLFILPERLFDTHLGVTMAELEFPVYFNYYVKQRQVSFLCRTHQLRPVLEVLQESVFGPPDLDLRPEYKDGADTPGYPDLAAEMKWFKKQPDGSMLKLNDMVTPLTFSQQGQAEFEGVSIRALTGDHYEFSRGGESHTVHFQPQTQRQRSLEGDRYLPPLFGVSIIGSGHGFDASTSTSGFLLWVNGHGILVDPPVNATDWLRKNGIDARLVQDVILTHCHADHDSGTLQKVLEESRVLIHTTPTVIHSFVRKYDDLIGLTPEQFRNLYDFQAVVVGQPIKILGAQFTFKYMFHPIPTLGFEVEFQGKRFAYSCDTLYDPDLLPQLEDQELMSPGRVDDLLGFNFDADLVLHEAGVPPIHTPVGVLAALPEGQRQNLYLTHVSNSSVPEGCGLRIAPTGVENTLILEVEEPPEVGRAQEMLEVLSQIDLFAEFKIGKALEFLRNAQYFQVPAGQVLIRTGEPGDCFYMILSGDAAVVRNNQKIKTVSRFDYVGEMAVVLNQPRYADVVAETDMEILSMGRREFLNFIEGSGLNEIFRRVSSNKMMGSWPLLSENRLLDPLTTYQKTQLLAVLQRQRFAADEVLFSVGEPVTSFYLVEEGTIRLEHPNGTEEQAARGALLLQVDNHGQPATHLVTAVAREDGLAYTMEAREGSSFMRANPGTFVRILAALKDSNSGLLI